jgi:hypothetical protein
VNLIVIENYITLDEHGKALDHLGLSLDRVDSTDVVNILNYPHVVLR